MLFQFHIESCIAQHKVHALTLTPPPLGAGQGYHHVLWFCLQFTANNGELFVFRAKLYLLTLLSWTFIVFFCASSL